MDALVFELPPGPYPVQADDRQNFVAELAASQGRRLRRFLAARLRNHADVADLAQEVFLRLLRVERQDKIRNPQAYLLTIAGHVLHQHALDAKAEPQGVDITEALEESEFADSSDPALQLHVERRLEDGLDIDQPVFKLFHYWGAAKPAAK